MGTLVNSSFENEYIWFLKNAMYLERQKMYQQIGLQALLLKSIVCIINTENPEFIVCLCSFSKQIKRAFLYYL